MQHPQMLHGKFDHFKIWAMTTPNIFQHIATGWPNAVLRVIIASGIAVLIEKGSVGKLLSKSFFCAEIMQSFMLSVRLHT